MYHDMTEAKRKLDVEFQQFDDKIIKTTVIKNSDNINRSVMNIFFYLFNDNQNKS
jgi:Uma2 family endonuclease